MSRVLIVAEGRGGTPHAGVRIRDVAELRRELVSGDLAHMTLAALRAGATEVTAVRANPAVPATLTFRDAHLAARNAGQIGNATLVHRFLEPGGRHTLIVGNSVIGLREEHRGLPSLPAVLASLNAGRLLHATRATGATKAAREAPDGVFLNGGGEGPSPTLDDWRAALAAVTGPRPDAMVIGSSEGAVVALAEPVAEAWGVPLYAGPGYHQTKAELKNAARALARATRVARVVCNTVVEQDLQTCRPQDYPAYHLAAFVAGLAATGVQGRNLPVDFLRLGFIFDDGDVAELEASGVLVVRYHHGPETFLLSRLEY